MQEFMLRSVHMRDGLGTLLNLMLMEAAKLFCYIDFEILSYSILVKHAQS